MLHIRKASTMATATQTAPSQLETTQKQAVDFYFDPICPWAWRTSLWIREVAKVRPIDVEWKFLSLDLANRAAGNPPKEGHLRSWKPLRAMALARRQGGDAAGDRLYLAVGRARPERRRRTPEPRSGATVPRSSCRVAITLGRGERVKAPSERALITLAMASAIFLTAISTAIVTTAAPSITGALGGLALYSWVFSA